MFKRGDRIVKDKSTFIVLSETVLGTVKAVQVGGKGNSVILIAVSEMNSYKKV